MPFGQALEHHKRDVESNPRQKPRAKLFRLHSEALFRRTWSYILEMEMRRITPEACSGWLSKFENGRTANHLSDTTGNLRGRSATTINAAIGFLRRAFNVGIRRGVIYRNPAETLEGKHAVRKLLLLPNRTQFAAIVSHIRSTTGTRGAVTDLVERLAYSGVRLGESRRICWRHFDFERGMLTVSG
jgi:integrase